LNAVKPSVSPDFEENDYTSKRDYPEEFRRQLTSPIVRNIKYAVGLTCEICHSRRDFSQLNVHHIYRLSDADGTRDLNSPHNLIVLCLKCHNSARNGIIADFELHEAVYNRSSRVKDIIENIIGSNRP
jgi:5-methylcytosine-specific restriction endonuclease McrA